MVEKRSFALLFAILCLLAMLSSVHAGETRVYLNATAAVVSTSPAPPNSENTTYSLSRNLSLSDRLNHTFNLTTAANVDVEYRASNGSGQYLLRFRIDYSAANGRITQPTCTSTTAASHSLICSANCNTGLDFNNARGHIYRVEFNSSAQNAKLFIDSATPVTLSLCTDVSLIGSVRFSANDLDSQPAGSGSGGGGGPYSYRQNLFIANNIPPQFLGTLSNLSWYEDSVIGFNLSSNYTDPNNDTLSYLNDAALNLTIFTNNQTGTINITPFPNYFGSQLIQFYATDGDNFTVSNIINLTVIGVNDVPNASLAILSSADAFNRSNGTLLTSWSYNDIENDAQSANETLWYLNGTEIVLLRNMTFLGVALTNKTQNWTFSVRSFDGQNFSAFTNSSSLLILNSPPTHSTPLVISSDSLNRLNGTLTCLNQSTTDLDSDALTLFSTWYKNGDAISSATNSLTLNSGNFSKRDNLRCEIVFFDGESNSSRLNSSNFTIANAAPLQNITLSDRAWDQDTSTSFNISPYFFDLDLDNLTFNYSAVSNLDISINNQSGMVSITPISGYSGSQSITFGAFDGTVTTASNTVTLTVNAATSPSSSSSSSGSSGGASSSGYTCRLDWVCSSWSECDGNEQTRKCTLVGIAPFKSLNSCPQNTIPQMKRECDLEIALAETCNDGIQNQDEEGIDCGGSCDSCETVQENTSLETQKLESTSSSNEITGAVIGGARKLPWVFAGIFGAVVLGVFSYAKFSRPKNLSQEEVQKILKESGWEPHFKSDANKTSEILSSQEKK